MPATIELLSFPGCPHANAARAQLRLALQVCGLPETWKEIDVTAPDAPAHARGYASPTVLVDGRDVLGEAPSGAPGCRLYPGSDQPGAPPLRALCDALRGT